MVKCGERFTGRMNRTLRSLATCLAGVGLLGSVLAASIQACTSFTLKGNDGGHVYARTMDSANR